MISADEFSSFATIYATNIKLNDNRPLNPDDLNTINFKACSKVEANFALSNITSTSSQVKEFITSNGMCMDLTEVELKSLYVVNNTYQIPYA